MNIVVCVKQVPDTWSERTLRPADTTLDRDAADAVINELDEYAIEEGLRLAEAHGGEVTILSMGPAKAAEAIRKALSMGADKAVHVLDDGAARLGRAGDLRGARRRARPDRVRPGHPRLGVDRRADGRARRDAGRAARRAAAVVRQQGGDRRADDHASTARPTTATTRSRPALPAVVSVVEKINEPRYPSFKGIMAAKKKPVETLSLADLGHRPGPGRAWPRSATEVVSFASRPPRQAGTIVTDEGDGGVKAAEFLAARKFI